MQGRLQQDQSQRIEWVEAWHWKICWIIVLALFVRVLAAFFLIGFDHPNEIYRSVEPIAHLRGYSTFLPFEWSDQLLFLLPIFVQYSWVEFLHSIGVSSPLGQWIGLKLVYGTLSLAPLLFVWRSSRSLWACLFLALWPELIYRSVRVMDYSLEMSFLALALFFAWKGLTQQEFQKKRGLVISGILLGALFFVRIQTGLHLISLVLVLLWTHRKTPSLSQRVLKPFVLLLSYGVTLFFLAWLDSRWSHTPLLTPLWNNIHFNVIQQGAVKGWGAQPWHRYFSEIFKFYGFFPILFGFIFWIKNPPKMIWVILLGFPFLVHSILAHKEARFMFGFVWLMVPLVESSVRRFYGQFAQKKWKAFAGMTLMLGLALNVYRLIPPTLQGSQTVREFNRMGDELGRVSQAHQDLPLLRVFLNHEQSPGSFFLRYRGPICYQNSMPCPKPSSDSSEIELKESSAGWVLRVK